MRKIMRALTITLVVVAVTIATVTFMPYANLTPPHPSITTTSTTVGTNTVVTSSTREERLTLLFLAGMKMWSDRIRAAERE